MKLSIAQGIAAMAISIGVGTSPVLAQFTSNNVTLQSHIPLSGFANAPGNGNDSWGYVSPSGREYALMGISNALAVVEITNPASPVIIAEIPHTNSLWADVKTFGTYAYVVNESGGGIDVIDLSGVDVGNVTLVQRVTTGGLQTAHNVAIDTVSGFLYLCLPNINAAGTVAFDLSNPANPVLAGMMANPVRLHDAQFVTYTTGPNAGKQICFGAGEGGGVFIIDVTDKANMFVISNATYPNLAYCHQCWLSEDFQHLYVNDELDGINETVVFDVSNLANPVLASTYNSGIPAADHNLYTHNGFIFEADYHGGVRIFCAVDPLNPVQVGWFDTFPADDLNGFDGAWSVYPYFPSGNIIVSDFNAGLFVLDPTAALSAGAVAITYPSGRPNLLNPLAPTTMQVNVSASCGGGVVPGSGLLHYNDGTGFVAVPLSPIAGSLFDATFPAFPCLTGVSYYTSAQSTTGGTVTDPAGAPITSYSATSSSGMTFTVSDNFEQDLGWVPTNLGATSGDWQRGVPVNDPNWAYDPATDGDGSGQCWLTQNQLGNSDVDGGAVRLTSPLLDLSPGDLTIHYEYYLRLTDLSSDINGPADKLLVEISSNGDAGPWTVIATHASDSGLFRHLGAIWTHKEISPADLATAGVAMTANTKIRFTANDGNPQSIVEAAIDGFQLFRFDCPVALPCPGDITPPGGNGTVNIDDLVAVLNAFGPCPGCIEDITPPGGNGAVNIDDLVAVLNAFGACP